MNTVQTGTLIAQPERARLPIRIPVIAQCGGQNVKAEVIGSTDNVLLLQGTELDATLPPLGTPVRLRVVWDRQLLIGRLAAHGVAGRFLVSIGERAIRYSRRFPVPPVWAGRSAHRRSEYGRGPRQGYRPASWDGNRASVHSARSDEPHQRTGLRCAGDRRGGDADTRRGLPSGPAVHGSPGTGGAVVVIDRDSVRRTRYASDANNRAISAAWASVLNRPSWVHTTSAPLSA
jgi:hypothetical protein